MKQKKRPPSNWPFPPVILVRLTVGLGNSLYLVLLLDGIAVRRSAGGVDDLVSKALGNGLDVAERGLAGTSGHEVNGLVHTAERGHVDCLPANHASRANAGRVFPRTAVDNSFNKHLDGVLVRENVNQLERVLNNAHSHELLAVVAAVPHHAAYQALHNGASGLPEALSLVPPSGVWEVSGVLILDGDKVL